MTDREIIWLKKLATQYRMDALWAVHKAGAGHATSSMSAMDILTVLYHGKIDGKPILQYDPAKPDWDERDYFILSKGHGCPALYAILGNLGFFPKEELSHLRQIGHLLEGHPIRKIPGIEATTGPLGQGISFGNGIALAMKLDKKPNRVYVLCGDGELQEGQIWESAMSASHHKLDNLIAFVDNNKLQQTGFVRSVMNVEPIRAKFEAFGWHVIPVADGHDVTQILDAIRRAWKVQRQPTMIVCETIKGKSIPFAEQNISYHGVALSKEEMATTIPLLEAELKRLEEEEKHLPAEAVN